MRISDWISDVGSSDLLTRLGGSPIALTAIGPLSGSEQPAIQSRAPATTVRIIGDRIAIASFDNASPERLLGPFASSDRSTFTGLSSIRCSTEGDGDVQMKSDRELPSYYRDRKSTRLNSSH